MKTGDLSSGPAKLYRAWENVMLHWETTKRHWHDPVSVQVEEAYLQPFTVQIQATLDRMRALSTEFHVAESDCNR